MAPSMGCSARAGSAHVEVSTVQPAGAAGSVAAVVASAPAAVGLCRGRCGFAGRCGRATGRCRCRGVGRVATTTAGGEHQGCGRGERIQTSSTIVHVIPPQESIQEPPDWTRGWRPRPAGVVASARMGSGTTVAILRPIRRNRPTMPCGAMKTKAITSTPSRKLAIGPSPKSCRAASPTSARVA